MCLHFILKRSVICNNLRSVVLQKAFTKSPTGNKGSTNPFSCGSRRGVRGQKRRADVHVGDFGSAEL